MAKPKYITAYLNGKEKLAILEKTNNKEYECVWVNDNIPNVYILYTENGFYQIKEKHIKNKMNIENLFKEKKFKTIEFRKSDNKDILLIIKMKDVSDKQ